MTRRARGRRALDHATPLIRALQAHEHRAAAALFALFVLVYLWPVLVDGGVLSPAALLYQWAPWRSVMPPDAYRYFNELLTDVPMSYYAWDVLARELLQGGTFPAWNPHALAGTPLYANLSVAWLSPFSLPLWTLPTNDGLGVAAALKLWTAAFGAYLLVRELRLGFWPGMLAGVSFALCAFDVVWLAHGAHVSVAVLLPWTIWLTERILRRGGRVEGIALAAVVAAALAGGHPGTQVHILAGTVLYAFVRGATAGGDVARTERLRRLATVGGGLAVGALLMAVVLVPGLYAAADTIGADARRGGGDASMAIGHTLPFEALKAAIFPDWWGRPSEGLQRPPLNYNERALYAGSLTLVLAAVALVSPGAWRRKTAFLTLAAIGLAVPFAVPPISDVVAALPAFNRVQNQRLLLWFAFAVAMLGAFGLEVVMRAPRQQLRAWIAVASAALVGLLALNSIESGPEDFGRAVDHMTDRFAGVTAEALALASVLRWLLLVAVVAVALIALRLRPQRPGLAGGLVVLVAALDMLLFANAFQPMGPASVTVPPPTPVVRFLQRHDADGRIAGLRYALTSDWSTVYGLRDARGYDAPQPSRRFFRLWATINGGQLGWRPLDVVELTPEGLSVLAVLGARYVVTDPNAAPPGLDEDFPHLSYAYRGKDATVFENGQAAPRAMVAKEVHVAPSEDDELATVVDPTFDPRREAVIRVDELDSAKVAGASGTARVVSQQNSRVTLHATLDRPGIVVLADAIAPGWSVTVDGRSATALSANVVMRGVGTPAGEHEIVWSYRVPGLRLGLVLSGLGLAALLGAAGVLVVRSRRPVR